jgi:hypothetical protein
MVEDESIPSDEELNAGDALGALDFNVEDEFKPDPLIPKGKYHGVANKITFDGKHLAIVWDFCLHDNGGAMSDGTTPIDGAHVFFRNWLPRSGDENIMTKSGRNNKRQSKINMLKQFKDEMSVDVTTAEVIALALREGQWIGTEADLEVDIDEYEGRFRNTVNRVSKSTL